MAKTEKKLWAIHELPVKNGGPIPMSIAGLYKACSEGKIPHSRIGKRIFVSDVYIQKLLNN